MLNPPSFPNDVADKGQVSLLLVLTLEEIWKARNFSLHHNCNWDVSSSISLIQSRCIECYAISAPLIAPHPPPLMHSWSPPPTDSIKINVDVAISDSQATIVVVACDHLGVPFKVWVMLIKRTYPLQVEIEALLWAVQLAKVEKWSQVIFEKDAKICFDAINTPNHPYPWSIHTQLLNILALVECFISCSFVWVSRTCNGVARHISRFSLESHLAFFFFLDNLPPALWMFVRQIIPLVLCFFSNAL